MARSLIPSYVDSKGRVHRKQSRTRIKTLMAKAKAAALLGIRDPRAVAQMDPDKDIGAKPDQAPEVSF